ncbi:Cleavage and polyadenylation specificity factor subunit 1 [Operophtera brumata]|uniref:Cleavage and polyadenylation specificity factor subunit 1 n=1 Tax=Operophtera brumata TaxID=104452 RepID=A0A0L7KVP1_OPEBR|nr:Cleavage and polyadenylation specificity factor subunit 1 [Operophtera brumata]
MAVNSLIYLNQSVPPYGGRLALSLRGGQLYVLTLLADSVREDPAAKKQRMEYDSINDCVASNVIEISDQDELEVYGSDIRTSTQLTSYVFEVCDSLLNVCPIGSVSMGEPQLGGPPTAGGEQRIELVACSGRGKNGALTVLQRSITPQLVLQTGQEINEVDNSGFQSGAPTVFAGNLGNNRFMVQVTSISIRLLKIGMERVVRVHGRPVPLRRLQLREGVKGEFTGKFDGKKMKGVNVKAEGFKPGTVYELNDEDELLRIYRKIRR